MPENNPFQQFGQLENTSFQRQYQADRMMNMFSRMDQSQARGYPRTSFAGGRGGLGQNPMLASMLSSEANTPDYSQFTYDPQARQAAQSYLSQFGLSPVAPQNVQHNAVLPNSGFFGNHPRLSGMLEGGIFGAAATRGSDTIGEGISNVAGGLLEGRMARQGMLNRQFERPFQAATMMEGMQDRTQRRELQAADIEHLRAENLKLGRPDHDFRAFGVSRNDPEIATVDNTDGSIKYTPNPHYDPQAARLSELDPAKRFFDAKQSEWLIDKKNNPTGAPPGSKQIGDWEREFRDKSQMAQREPQTLGIQPDGTVVDIRPGMKVKPGTTPLSGSNMLGGITPQQKESLKPIDDEIKKTNSKAFDQQVQLELLSGDWMKNHKFSDVAGEIKTRRAQRLQELQQQKDQIMNANPMGGGGGQPQVRDYTQIQ